MQRAAAPGSDAAARRVLFIFVDGIGLGPTDAETNALVDSMPFMTARLGRPPVAGHAPSTSADLSLVPLDATLGMPGLPQSGTGQASLLTGFDAVGLHGAHFGPWVPARLRTLVRERSILARASEAGMAVAFANAYPEEILQQLDDAPDGPVCDTKERPGRARRTPPFLRAGPPLAALGAGLLTRHTEALYRGDAVASEIDNEGWRHRLGRTALPTVSPAEAGHNLARIANAHDLTLFAHYSTDTAGHRKDIIAARAAVRRLDAFLEGVLARLDADTFLIVASDHGNVEDCTVGHTRNPALCLLAGPGHAAAAADLRDLTDVAGAIMGTLGIDGG